MSMLNGVIQQLSARKGSWPAICGAIPSVKYSWLSKLATGKIAEPSVVKIQALHDYFAAHPTVLPEPPSCPNQERAA